MRNLSDVVKAYDVRGVVPDQLDPEVTRALGAAFAELLLTEHAAPDPAVDRAAPDRAAVVVGHDMRPSSPGLSEAFADGVTSRGLDVVQIGLASTDGLYYASGALGAAGAMFTASHNPAQYNGIKLCRAGARPVGQDSGLVTIRERAEQLLAGGDGRPPTCTAGRTTRRDVLGDYAGYLRGLVDVSAVRPLRVVVDAGNGMAGLTVPAVLGSSTGLPGLPLEVVPLYFELDGAFPNHEANPLDPANLRDLQAAVLADGADLGLAFDGDADRCFVIDELGRAVSPSAVTALVADREIAKERAAGRTATVIHNVITSRTVPEVVAAAGARPVRTRVGHSFIKQQMAEQQAVFGGEHSAHYYFRDFWYADTGMLAALHVLAALGEQPGPLSALVSRYQRYVESGEINSTVADAAARTAAVRTALAADDVEQDTLDGLTLTRTGAGGGLDWWVNVRASNTEPLLRLNVEAGDLATMEHIRDTALRIIRS